MAKAKEKKEKVEVTVESTLAMCKAGAPMWCVVTPNFLMQMQSGMLDLFVEHGLIKVPSDKEMKEIQIVDAKLNPRGRQ